MNRWLDVVAGVVLGLVVNECTAVSPWLAHKTVRWAAVIRRPDRIDEFVEVRSATINDRPGKLFKLFTALGFLFAALAYRAAEPGPAGRPSLLGVLRVRVQAAGIAGVLYAVTMGLNSLFYTDPLFVTMVFTGSALSVIALVVFHLPSPRWKMTLGCAVLPTALVLSLWSLDPGWSRVDSGTTAVILDIATVIATVIAPVYGVAQAVRASLRKSRLLTGAGSMAAVGVVITTGAAILDTTTSYNHFTEILFGICLGVVGGLHVGVGLLVIEDFTKQWNTVVATPPDAVPPVGRQNSALDR